MVADDFPKRLQPTGACAPGGSHVPHDPDALWSGEDDEIDLWQVLEALSRQKWLIAGCIAGCLLVAVAYLLAADPLYEVSAQVRPGITAYNGEAPQFGWSVEDIETWVSDGHYRPYLAEFWPRGEGGSPQLKARKSKGGKFVTLYLRSPKPEQGVQALEHVLQRWVQDYGAGSDAQIQATARDLDRNLKSLQDELKSIQEIEARNLKSEITERQRHMQALNHKIRQVEQQKAVTQNSLQAMNVRMDKTLENSDTLTRLRDESIQKGRTEGLSFLLFTNIIQQNIYHVSDLLKRISELQNSVLEYEQQIVDLEKQVVDAKETIEQLKRQKDLNIFQKQERVRRTMEQLELRKRTLAPIEMIARPLAGDRPVAPKRLLTLALALLTGGLIGVMAAWLRLGWQARASHPS